MVGVIAFEGPQGTWPLVQIAGQPSFALADGVAKAAI
jgi:hypothetical protein